MAEEQSQQNNEELSGQTDAPLNDLNAAEPSTESTQPDDLEMPDMDFAKPKHESAAESEKVINPSDISEEDAEAEMLKMMEQETAGGVEVEEPVVEKASFDKFDKPAAGEPKNLDMLMDVSLPIAIELGRTSMAIEDILNLGPGSVVELDKLAGEPVDLLVNNRLLAKGEVVVIDENFGVRITSMISRPDRIRSLK